MKSNIRSELTPSTDVYIVYRGKDAIGSIQVWPVFPDDPIFDEKKWIAQLRGSKIPLGEYVSLKAAITAIDKATSK